MGRAVPLPARELIGPSRRVAVGAILVALPMTVVMALPGASTAATQDQEDEPTGVTFLDDGPLAFTKPAEGQKAAPSIVEVFNGSPKRQLLEMIPDDSVAKVLEIAPRERRADAGEIVSFRVTALSFEQRTGELRVVSGDGTIAKRQVTIATPASTTVGPPAKLGYKRQKPLALDDADVGVGPVHVPGLAGPDQETTVGVLSNGKGNITSVKVEKDALTIVPVETSGEYTGTLNLTPQTADASKTELTFKVKDNWLWPGALLFAGLVLGTVSELWLTRWRPRFQLGQVVRRLKGRVKATADQVEGELAHGASEPPNTTWRVPRIYSEQGPSLLERATKRLTDGLDKALSDSERERFGPDGKEMEKAEAQVEKYEGALGDCSGIAERFTRLQGQAVPNPTRLNSGALSTRVAELLSAIVLRYPSQLDALETEAKDLRSVVDGFARLIRGYAHLEEHPNKTPEQQEEINKQRGLLFDTVSTKEDLEAQEKLYDDLLNAVYGTATVHKLIDDLRAVTGTSRMADRPPDRQATPQPPPPPTPTVSAAGAKPSWFERNIGLEDLIFSAISGVLVFASGLVTLYLTNETFGSTADYLGVFLWGSTVQGGIAFVRRLVPGGIKSLAGSSS